MSGKSSGAHKFYNIFNVKNSKKLISILPKPQQLAHTNSDQDHQEVPSRTDYREFGLRIRQIGEKHVMSQLQYRK